MRERARPRKAVLTGAAVLLLAAAAVPAGADHIPLPQLERDALVAFYNATGGPGWSRNDNWLGSPGTECTWFGVACGGVYNKPPRNRPRRHLGGS